MKVKLPSNQRLEHIQSKSTKITLGYENEKKKKEPNSKNIKQSPIRLN
jgi:hypothetical protein